MATETIQATDHKLYVAGEWIETGEWSEVKAPYDGTLIGRVPKGDAALVGKAVEAARAAFDALSGSLTAVRTPIGEARILTRDEPAFRAPERAAAAARLLPSGSPSARTISR